MNHCPSMKLAEAKQKVAGERKLKELRKQSFNEWTKENYRLNRLEAEHQQVAAELARLEKGGISTIADSLLGRRDDKIENCRNLISEIECEHREADAATAALEKRIEDVDRQLQDLENAETHFQNALKEAEKSLLAIGDERADRLVGIANLVDQAKQQLRATESALLEGEAVLHRLTHTNAAVKRARRNHIHVNEAPFIAAAWNRFRDTQAGEFVVRLREGLQELQHAIAKLELAEQNPTDREIVGTGETLHCHMTSLDGTGASEANYNFGAANPIEDDVRSMVRHLEDRVEDLKKQMKTLEAERCAIAESFA